MENFEAVQKQINDMALRLGTIEEAMTFLIEESEARQASTSVPSPVPPPVQSPVSSAGMSPRISAVRPAAVSSPSPTSRSRPQAKPTNWLGLISVVCFLLAAVFIIKLAVETGWLTPSRQMGLAALFGFLLIGSGFMMLSTDRAYASLLPGAGVAVLYLTAVASHTYYGLYGAPVALAVITLVSAGCLWLFTIFKHEVYPLTAAVGVYLAPFLLGENAQSDFTVAYHLSATAAFAVISIWLETRLLTIVGAYCAIAATLLLRSSLLDVTLLAVAMVIHFACYVVAVVVHSSKTGRALKSNEAWGYFPVLLLFYVGEYSFISELNPGLAPWLSLAFAGFLIGIYFAARKALDRDSLESAGVISTFATVVLFHSLYLEILPDAFKVWSLPLIVVIMIFVPLTFTNQDGALRNWKLVPFLALGFIVVSEYLSVLFAMVDSADGYLFLPVAFAALGSLLGFYFLRARTSSDVSESAGMAVLGAAHVMAIFSLYRLLEASGSLAVSIAWLLYASAIMSVGFILKDKLLTKSALAALGLAAAKALLYDASSAATVVRITCLALTGAVLYGCGLLLKKTDEWS